MNRQIRLLLPWLEDNEAIASLLGRLPNVGEDVAGHKVVLNASRVALRARAPYALQTPTLLDFPPELQDAAAQFCGRPEIIAAMQGLDWKIGIADLNQVLSFQKIVAEDHAVERATSADLSDPSNLFSFCLPTNGLQAILSGSMDHDQKAITLSSLNPNLRVGGQLAIDMEVPAVPGSQGKKEKVVGFAINFGANFVQIAEYNGRWFVRDGYHRTYGLLRQGIQHAPCVFVKARSFQELGAAAPGFLPYEVLFNDRPPFLTDFLDDTFSVLINQKAMRKVVRISAEEFLVEI
jgi:hypothetical protein